MEVKSHSFHGHSSTTGAEINFFIPFLNEFGNSKLFELDLIFHHGTTMAVETEQFTSIIMVEPADDLAE